MDSKTKHSPVSLSYTAFLAQPKSPQALAKALRSLDDPKLNDIAEAFQSCTKGNRCRLTICPACGPGHQKRAGIRILRDILGHIEAEALAIQHEDFFTGRITTNPNRAVLDMNRISFVTINGPVCATTDPAEIASTKSHFKEALRNLRKRKAKSLVWSGQFEISLSERPRIHFHGLFYHPHHTKVELRDLLKESYKEARAVNVSSWNGVDRITAKKALRKIKDKEWKLDHYNLAKAARYGGKALPDLPHRVDDKKRIGNRRELELLARYLIQTSIIRGDKFKGSRFSSGLKEPKGWKWTRSFLIQNDGGTDSRHFEVLDIARGSNGKGMDRKLARELNERKKSKRITNKNMNDNEMDLADRIQTNYVKAIAREVTTKPLVQVYTGRAMEAGSNSPAPSSNQPADSTHHPQKHRERVCRSGGNRRDNPLPDRSARPDRGSG